MPLQAFCKIRARLLFEATPFRSVMVSNGSLSLMAIAVRTVIAYQRRSYLDSRDRTLMDRQTDREAGRQAGRQTDRQKDRQIDRKTNKKIIEI